MNSKLSKFRKLFLHYYHFCISPFMILGGYENSCRSIFCSAVLCNHLHFWYGAIRRQKNIRMLERVHHEISSYLSCKFIRIRLHQQISWDLYHFAVLGNSLSFNVHFYVFQFDWIIWPPTQYINFKYIPQSARVLYVNIITVLWDIFLSYIKHIDEVSRYLEKVQWLLYHFPLIPNRYGNKIFTYSFQAELLAEEPMDPW